MAYRIRLSSRGGSLWQGGSDDAIIGSVEGKTFDVVVLCAEEFQPESRIVSTAGKPSLIYAPNDDSYKSVTRAQLSTAIAAARACVRHYRQGKAVLISCMLGRNRSGLVMALTLHLLYGMSGASCVDYIRRIVPHALTNDSFEAFLKTLPAKVRT